jgi:PAS domain S-box-containing protein
MKIYYNKYSDYLDIIAPALISVVLFAIAIFMITFPQIEQSILDHQEENARNIVNVAISLLEYQNELVNDSVISLKAAQAEAIEGIKHIRYGKEYKDYLWINDMHPNMIMHPYRPDLNGRDLSNYKDAKGKKLFVDFVKVVQDSGQGFVDYIWQWQDDYQLIAPKISFVREFKPWGWIIGTGVYIEDVKAEVAAIKQHSLMLSLAIFSLILVLQVIIIRQNMKIKAGRMRIEDQLRVSQKRFKELAELLPQIVFELDTDGNIIFANNFAYEFTGYTESDVANGLNISSLFSPENFVDVRHRLARALNGQGSSGSEHKILLKNNKEAYVRIFANAIARDNRITGIRGVAFDITEYKMLQEQGYRAQRLEVAGRIAGQVAHDFNNLLGPLMTYPELIRKEFPENQKLLNYISKMEKAAANIAEINQQLSDLSRRQQYDMVMVNLNEIILRVINRFETTSPGIEFDLNFERELLPIKGGPPQLYRVFQNLIANAIEAMDGRGKITIKTENYYEDISSGFYNHIPKNEYAKVTIIDIGRGIKADIMPKIFDPYFSTKDPQQKRGGGLGLTVVDSIMDDHQAIIDFRTAVGIGTSFYLYFPITRDDNRLGKTMVDQSGGESILVVDDDAIQREILLKLLSNLGYKVQTAKSGEEALAKMQNNTYDLLILDMLMAGINGIETYRRVITLNLEQKAIVASGSAIKSEIDEAISLGIGAYMKKPISPKTLANIVRQVLDSPIEISRQSTTAIVIK